MKRFQLFLVLASVLVMLQIVSQSAQAKEEEPSEPYPGMPLCLPDAYLTAPDHCLLLGPSQTLSEMAQMGMSYPTRPMPVKTPPLDLTKNPAYIAKINIDPTEAVRLYATLEEAVGGTNPVRTIAPGNGLRYVSFIQEARVDGNSFVMLKSGEWVRASPAGTSTFQGVLFTKTPTTSFGWVIDTIRASAKPSFTAPEVGEVIQRETFTPIYQVIEAEGMEWYLIGMDQWVPYLKARRARVDTTPPAGVTGDRWISVDLYDQIVMVYENRQLVFATLVATGGEPFYTRPGLFQIYQKKPFETMSGAFEPDKSDYYYLEDVPWTMYFDEARALHGAYWRPWFGVAGSHGCVNFSLGDANWLFQWAKEGDWVYVWDASGNTPTDPKYYGAGGA
jgi:lipoprotein-anchoring transpeptidase ErfK/SrfK